MYFILLYGLFSTNFSFSYIYFSDGYDTFGTDSEIDDSTKPLTRAELQSLVMDGVKRKEMMETVTKDTHIFDAKEIKEKTPQKAKPKK